LLDSIDQFLVLLVDQNGVGQPLVGGDFLRVAVLLDRGDICGRSGSILARGFRTPAVALAQEEGERQGDDQHEEYLWEGRQPCTARF
jgi:hypothetical protein